MPSEFTPFDPSFFDYIVASKDEATTHSATLNCNRSAGSTEREIAGENLDEVISGNFKNTLKKILNEVEFETFLRRVYLKKTETYEKIGQAVYRDKGTVQRAFKSALKKCRIHFATEIIHQHAAHETGCTLHPITLCLNNFAGFAVSKDDGRKIFTKCPTKRDLKKYLEKYQTEFNFEEKRKGNTTLHVGVSKSGDEWLLEQNYIIEEFKYANARAILEDQKTMFDFQQDRKIKVQYPIYPAPE
ncbi:hypothetical protein [Gimesia panareensis]|uniref:hypothetical protein n=1 Tax=Gimesia panareensis TaxID=2527978 RepID=UPI00118A90BE|nr:hypothetical protein [Gimesia panareensis]QDU52132.1 hypothetical protein Pan110_45040 [Gimesia panareensis]